MSALETFETITNWVAVAGTITLLSAIIVSWLASYRQPKAAPVGSGDWFFVLPAWAQIVGGFAACALLAYLGYLLWIPLPLALSYNTELVLRILGLAFFLAGWVLALWARWALGTMYGVSTSLATQLQAQHRLVQDGPYAFTRHPMYLGYWLALLGVTLIYRTWTPLVLLVMCLPSFYRRARREETALAEQFGEKWQAYAARTKFMIPWVY